MVKHTRRDFRTALGWRGYQATVPIFIALTYASRPIAKAIVWIWEKRRDK